jgi:hypothetical protein
MIFTKKNYKIPSGTNPSFFAVNSDEIEFYVFDSSTYKYVLTFSNTLKCSGTKTTFPYNYVCKITNDTMCVCFDDNMSVIYEKN